MKVSIMGVMFDDYTPQDFIYEALKCIERKQQCTVVTPNAEIGLLCKKDPDFKALVNDCTLVLPDGISIKIAAKILNKPIKEKAAGVEFSEGMCESLAKRAGSVYLFGAKPGVAEAAGQKLCEKYPGLHIAGTHDGYFKPEDEAGIVEDICKADPDMLLVCLGAPKQEWFIGNHKKELPPCVMVGCGGSIDVFAGNSKRAPKLFIKLGLEWFYRLLCEPWRIKRMIKLPIYLWDAFIYRLKGEKENG